MLEMPPRHRSGMTLMATGMLVRGAPAAALVVLPIATAAAQSPAEFYKGKTVDL
jgi:hypothetical protein